MNKVTYKITVDGSRAEMNTLQPTGITPSEAHVGREFDILNVPGWEIWLSRLIGKWRTGQWVACENIRFSSLFAAGDVSRGGTSATQRQKFHTDDANQCLHNKSGSHGVPNTNLSNFTCLLVDFGKVLCSSANELQQNSNACSTEDYIPQILTVLLAFCLSFVNNS